MKEETKEERAIRKKAQTKINNLKKKDIKNANLKIKVEEQRIRQEELDKKTKSVGARMGLVLPPKF